MGIIIKEVKGEHWLYSITHTPTPGINGLPPQDFWYMICVGRMKDNDLCGLELNKEYNMNHLKDFEVVERIPQVLHDNGFIYDDLFYKLNNYA